MLDVNELRRKNWVLWHGPDHIEKAAVSSICKEEVGFRCGDYGLVTELSPIPLTPETISRCTSLKLKISDGWWDSYQTDNGWWVSYAKHTEPSAGVDLGNFYYGEDYTKVESVHDLQNLHFCTNFKKELEFIW